MRQLETKRAALATQPEMQRRIGTKMQQSLQNVNPTDTKTLWQAVLESAVQTALDTTSEKEWARMWHETEEPGAALVLRVGRRHKDIGWDVAVEIRVDTPLFPERRKEAGR